MTNTIANRIYLIGMMASGKSTVGKELAEQLGYDFIDMDAVIESNCSMSINEIFEVHGETYFRQIEHDLLSQLSSRDNIVISTGGGTPIYHHGIQLMNVTGTTVWLKVSKDEIHFRLSKNSNRPLASQISLYGLSRLMYKRNPIYKQASIKVWNKGKLESVVLRILNKLKNRID